LRVALWSPFGRYQAIPFAFVAFAILIIQLSLSQDPLLRAQEGCHLLLNFNLQLLYAQAYQQEILWFPLGH